MEKTVPVQFNLDNILPGYVPSEEDQQAILGIIQDVIRENLDPSLGLDDVSISSDNPGGAVGTPRGTRRRRRLQQNSLYLPLGVTVRGSSKDIDEAYPEVLEIAEKYKDEILRRLKEYDLEVFDDVEVSSEAYDAPDFNTQTTITTHPVQFYFNRVEKGYVLSREDRESFILFVKETLVEEIKMNAGWKFIQVAYWSRYEVDEDTPSLPTRITIRGGMDKDKDDAISFLMSLLESDGVKADFEDHLRSLDQDAFGGDFFVTYEANDLPPVEVPTFVSTKNPHNHI